MFKIKTLFGIFATIICLFCIQAQAQTPFASSLVLDLPFDGSAVDVGPNHFMLSTIGGKFVADRAGQSGFALSLNGTNQNVSLPYNAAMYPTEMTLSLWVNFQRFGGGILKSGDAMVDPWRGFQLLFDNSQGVYYNDFTGSYYNASLSAPATSFALGRWSQIVISRTTNSATMYINGVKVSAATNLTAYVKPLSSPLSLGANEDRGSFFDYCAVTMDAVHMYNRALSSNEVQSLYTQEAPAAPASPLVLDLPFDGSVKDMSSNHFTVMTNGGTFVADRLGQPKSAISLNGVNENVYLPFNAAMYPTEMTMSLWVNMQSSQGVILDSGDATTSDSWHGLALYWNVGALTYQDYTGSGYNAMVVGTTNQCPLKQWNQIVISRSTNSCAMYINGIKVDGKTNLTAYAKPGVTALSLGANQNGRFYEFCAMAMDQVHIYNYAFSSNEVRALYTAEAPPGVTNAPATSLVLDLPFDGSVKDMSSNRFTVSTNGGKFVADRAGLPGSAFSLNGTNENVFLPFNPALYPAQTTLSLWVNFKKIGGSILRAGDATSDSWRGYALGFDGPPGVISYRDYTGSTYNANVSAPSNCFALGQWSQVVISRSTNSCTMYVNGIKVSANTNLTAYAKPGNTPLSLGANQNGSFYDFCAVTMDQVHIYNYALSSNEVQTLYTNEAPAAPASPLVLDLPFDGSVKDMSSNRFTVSTNGGKLVADRAGLAGSAFSLNGTNENVFLPFNSALYPAQLTLSLWVKFQKFGGMIMRGGDAMGDSWRGYALGFDGPPGVISYRDYTGSTYNANVSAPSNCFALGQWSQVVISRSTNSCTMYVNGIKVDANTNLTAYAKPGSTPLSLGANQNGFFYDFCAVTMDQVHIYNYALSSNDVQTLYGVEAKGISPKLSIVMNNTLYFSAAPKLSPKLVSNGVKMQRIDMQVMPGQNYQLQSSTNLNSWQGEGTPFTATGISSFQDVDVTADQKYFRLINMD